MTDPDETVDQLVRRRRGDPHTALRFGDDRWTWDEHARASAARAAVACARRLSGPFHIGYLLENVPELSFWLGAGAVAGATMVGVNPTRRGAELASDVRHTDCQLLVTERKHLPLLDGLDLGIERDRILVVDTEEHADECEQQRDAPFPEESVSPDATALLVFTSGTSGAPKRCDRVAAPTRALRTDVVREPGTDRRVGVLPRHLIPLCGKAKPQGSQG